MTDPYKQLENIEDAMIEDILSLSDEEVMTEAREDDLLSEWLLMVYGYPHVFGGLSPPLPAGRDPGRR